MIMEKNQKSWYKKWWAISLFIFFGVAIIGSLFDENSSTDQSETPSSQDRIEVKNTTITERDEIIEEGADKQDEQIKKVSVPEENSKLTHGDLVDISSANTNGILGRSYQMTLYLEQPQTSAQAEFMSQPDNNSMDTVLITCNMKPDDLDKLDGESAQKRVYKPYDVQLVFTRYNENVGLYYEADCSLK